jgi:CheY-like chemotaxis protein
MPGRKAADGTGKSNGAAVGKTIVLADEERAILDALGELLRHKDFIVHPASDGLEALCAIRRVKPDYVILDAVMPKLDGSRVCAMLRHDPLLRHIPVIALSALSPEQLRSFPALSADAYVAKAPLAVMAGNVLQAIKHLDERGRGDLGGGILGYEGFRARSLVSHMLAARQHWETLLRTFPHPVLELDAEGRILAANAEASRVLGRPESRLIGEPFAGLAEARDAEAVAGALADLGKRLGDQSCVTAALGGRDLLLRLASAVEGGECTGILVTLEPVPADPGRSGTP